MGPVRRIPKLTGSRHEGSMSRYHDVWQGTPHCFTTQAARENPCRPTENFSNLQNVSLRQRDKPSQQGEISNCINNTHMTLRTHVGLQDPHLSNMLQQSVILDARGTQQSYPTWGQVNGRANHITIVAAAKSWALIKIVSWDNTTLLSKRKAKQEPSAMSCRRLWLYLYKPSISL